MNKRKAFSEKLAELDLTHVERAIAFLVLSSDRRI